MTPGLSGYLEKNIKYKLLTYFIYLALMYTIILLCRKIVECDVYVCVAFVQIRTVRTIPFNLADVYLSVKVSGRYMLLQNMFNIYIYFLSSEKLLLVPDKTVLCKRNLTGISYIEKMASEFDFGSYES